MKTTSYLAMTLTLLHLALSSTTPIASAMSLCQPRKIRTIAYTDDKCTKLATKLNRNCGYPPRNHYEFYTAGCHKEPDGSRIKIECDEETYHVSIFAPNSTLPCESRGEIQYDLEWDKCYPVKEKGSTVNTFMKVTTNQTQWDITTLSKEDLQFYQC